MSKKDNVTELKGKKRVFRDLSPVEVAAAMQELAKNPQLTDAEVATKLVDAGLCSDYDRKVLRNKIRYLKKDIANPNKHLSVKVLPKSGESTANESAVSETTVVPTADNPDVPADNSSDTNEKDDKEKKEKKPKKPKVIKKETLNEDGKTPFDIIEAHGYDPDIIGLTNLSNRTTRQETDDGRVVTYTTTRTNFAPRNPKKYDAQGFFIHRTKEVLLNDVDKNEDIATELAEAVGTEKAIAIVNALAEKKAAQMVADKNAVVNVTNKKRVKKAIICPLTDLHIGEGDVYKVAKSYYGSFARLLNETKLRYRPEDVEITSFDIALMGDMVHCDNKAGTTAAGTVVGNVGSIYRAMDVASNLIVKLVLMAKNVLNVPIRLFYVYGNHDTTTGFAVLRTIQANLRFVEGVQVITNPHLLPFEEEFDKDIDHASPWYDQCDRNPEYIWIKYGRMGVVFCHGKFGRKNVTNVPKLANRNCQKITDRQTVIHGHLHQEYIQHVNSDVDVFGLSTPNFCSDAYAKSCGYLTEPTFYLLEVDYSTNRVSCTYKLPSLPIEEQEEYFG